MSLVPILLRSLVRLVWSLMQRPAASVTTILYYSDLLPRDTNLERLVRTELLHHQNHLFRFVINMLRCFWKWEMI
ncbi:hypothetical protein H6P81_010165 [Aristolochia fimbriata]|uniref:Secreted protein n=1 Tax=Aristolochia fimbriata TaxID=158543 RepID=A0AAV7EN24_ARIFI|nr:hypothetical protein H6P81_010165 [Aristolochia fimbriata]